MLKILFIIASIFLQPCEYEDSTNCVWNAKEQGNQIGHSFISLNGYNFYVD